MFENINDKIEKKAVKAILKVMSPEKLAAIPDLLENYVQKKMAAVAVAADEIPAYLIISGTHGCLLNLVVLNSNSEVIRIEEVTPIKDLLKNITNALQDEFKQSDTTKPRRGFRR